MVLPTEHEEDEEGHEGGHHDGLGGAHGAVRKPLGPARCLADSDCVLVGLVIGQHVARRLAHAFRALPHVVDHRAHADRVLGQFGEELTGLVVADVEDAVERAAHYQHGHQRAHRARQANPLAQLHNGFQHKGQQHAGQHQHQHGLGNVHQGQDAAHADDGQRGALNAGVAAALGVAHGAVHGAGLGRGWGRLSGDGASRGRRGRGFRLGGGGLQRLHGFSLPALTACGTNGAGALQALYFGL